MPRLLFSLFQNSLLLPSFSAPCRFQHPLQETGAGEAVEERQLSRGKSRRIVAYKGDPSWPLCLLQDEDTCLAEA